MRLRLALHISYDVSNMWFEVQLLVLLFEPTEFYHLSSIIDCRGLLLLPRKRLGSECNSLVTCRGATFTHGVRTTVGEVGTSLESTRMLHLP